MTSQLQATFRAGGTADDTQVHSRGAAALAELAFRADSRTDANVTSRPLALLTSDSLELDLTDPEQRRFGDYELLEKIGEGGMGVVYRARQVSLDREVAVKLLAAGPWASRDFVARFEREAQHAARMQHPHIVAVYEVGEFDAMHFFSMALVRGESLAEALHRQGHWDVHQAARLMRTVAEAVAYAHSLGVLHLDMKPGNILLDEAGVPHVADFGLARRFDFTLAAERGEISGTPSYMAPEQADPAGQALTPATDIWGLGAVLYEMLTGRPPFAGDGARATLEMVATRRVTPPRQLRVDLPRDLEAILRRCLAIVPGKRYATARGLADDLGRFLEHRPVSARPLNAAQRIGRWARRQPKIAIAAALVALSLVAGLVATTSQWQRAERNASRAEAARDFLTSVFEQANPDVNRGHSFTARELLDHGAATLSAGGDKDSALHADLTGLLAQLYWSIGDYTSAEPLLKQALQAADDPGIPAEIRARALIVAARTDNDGNKYTASEAHARKALTLLDSSGDTTGIDASNARRLVAAAVLGQGEAAKAEPLLRDALARDRKAFGVPSEMVIEDLNYLASALKELGRFDESASLAEEMVDLATNMHGRVNSGVVDGLELLASAECHAGRCADAEKNLREAVTISEKLYGPEHRETIVARSNLLWTLESQGRFEEALQGRLELLKAEQTMEKDRPEQMAYAWNFIASDYLGLGRFGEAEDAARKSLAQWKLVHGSDSEWDSADVLNNLATAQMYRGDLAGAEQTFRRELAIQQAHEAPNSIWMGNTRMLLGKVLLWQGHAVEALTESRAAWNALPVGADPLRASMLAMLTEAELDADNLDDARQAGERAVAMTHEVTKRKSLRWTSPDYALARVELASGHAGKAEPLLREALALRSAAFPAHDPRVLEVQVALVQALSSLGRQPEADALRATITPLLRELAAAQPYAATLLQRMQTPAPPVATVNTGH
ncbi:MAG: tetratricopeptide repeat protein [Lysobacterales bacterium]